MWTYEPGDQMVDAAYTLKANPNTEIQVSGRTCCLNLWVLADEAMHHLSAHPTLDAAKAAALAYIASTEAQP